MNKSIYIKLLVDFFMFLIFVLAITYPISTHYMHEIFGVAFISSLTMHIWLNCWWFKSLKKGKYNLVRILHTIVNVLLVMLIFVNIVTALGISQWLFLFLPFDFGITGRNFHVLSAYWGMIILAIHIGFHWNMLMNITRKILRLTAPHMSRTIILRILSLIIVIYGLHAANKLEIGARLIAYYSFFFIDTNQTFLLLLNYISFFGCIIVLTHYGLKILRKT